MSRLVLCAALFVSASLDRVAFADCPMVPAGGTTLDVGAVWDCTIPDSTVVGQVRVVSETPDGCHWQVAGQTNSGGYEVGQKVSSGSQVFLLLKGTTRVTISVGVADGTQPASCAARLVETRLLAPTSQQLESWRALEAIDSLLAEKSPAKIHPLVQKRLKNLIADLKNISTVENLLRLGLVMSDRVKMSNPLLYSSFMSALTTAKDDADDAVRARLKRLEAAVTDKLAKLSSPITKLVRAARSVPIVGSLIDAMDSMFDLIGPVFDGCGVFSSGSCGARLKAFDKMQKTAGALVEDLQRVEEILFACRELLAEIDLVRADYQRNLARILLSWGVADSELVARSCATAPPCKLDVDKLGAPLTLSDERRVEVIALLANTDLSASYQRVANNFDSALKLFEESLSDDKVPAELPAPDKVVWLKQARETAPEFKKVRCDIARSLEFPAPDCPAQSN